MDNKQKAVFIDKDGTLIPDIPYNVNTGLITLEYGVIEGLQLLKFLQYKFFIITNQSGIARGYYDEQALTAVYHKLVSLLQPYKINLSGFYYCPHYKEGKNERYAVECTCRKPLPGLIMQAAAEHNLHLQNSWMIGDILNDVEAGNRAGCRSVLIDNGNETEWLLTARRTPAYTATSFLDAAQYIANFSYANPIA